MNARYLFAALSSALLIGCGVEGDGSGEPRQVQYSRGALTIPGTKSPDWPVAEAPIAGAGRVRNVVLVSLDTLRRDYVSAYHDLPDLPVSHATPHIDALAARGALFLDAMAPSPSTGPSHHAIFSGLPAPIGKKRNYQQVIGGSVAHPIETLQAGGFRTAAFAGDGQMAPIYGWTVGFDEYTTVSFGTLGMDSPEYRELAQIERKSFAWLDRHHEDAFFLFLHSYETHCPYWPPPEQRAHYLSWYEGEARRIECRDLGQDSKVDHTLARALYAGGVAYADEFIGRLWAKLQSLGRTHDTMIILLSDHGEQLGEDDGYIGHARFHPSVMRIPLIVYLPGAQPLVASAPVTGVDVIPTIYSALGLQPPYEPMGRDLLPLIDGEAPGFSPRRLRFAHMGRNFAVYERDSQLTAWAEPRSERLLNWRTGARGPKQQHPGEANRLRFAHDRMIQDNGDIARKFHVIRTVRTTGPGSDDPARRELAEKLRALGYIQ